MTITVTNQLPAVLDPVHTLACGGAYDPLPALRTMLVDPLLRPLPGAAAVTVTDGGGHDLTADLPDLILRCLGDRVDVAAEATVKSVLGQTLVHFDPQAALPVGEVFAVQAGQQHKWPAPSARVLYSAQHDVIPAAKGLLAGSADPSELFAALAYTYHPHTLGFWFPTSAAFDDFRAWLAQQVGTLSSLPAMPPDTVRLMADFGKLTLTGLTESLVLRRDDADGNHPFSFARLLVNLLMTYVRQQQTNAGTVPGNTAGAVPGSAAAPQAGVLPFTLGELLCPRTLVLVNVEAHARATPARVTHEWDLIRRCLAGQVTVVSHTHLSKLTSLARAAVRAQVLGRQQQPGQPGSRSAQVKFRKAPPSRLDLYGDLVRVLRRMHTVNRSQHVFRSTKMTFLKANRRDPADFNKPGRSTAVRYLPDLHIYIDTSGSISEVNYQEAVLMLIGIAQKLNINLYFNSFSHVLSQETLLKVANRSRGRIWQEFRRVPKVTGGTDFKQVWDHINAAPVRRRRLSLMITDFVWAPPPTREEHPATLFYAPCSAMDWGAMVSAAETFTKAMKHIDPSIRQKLLGMVV
ncbi:hypothetical protein [Granulicoccus phenolivorans]|uniref:hypothetical protein n=1 Tax=Granulicoccus phenolivorans TaxID=266854 RepID=UPI0004257581|nr:hypothetical protein [Granulicoccus phenolivorans]